MAYVAPRTIGAWLVLISFSLVLAAACTTPTPMTPSPKEQAGSASGPASGTVAFLQAQADSIQIDGAGGAILAIELPDGRILAAASGHQSGGDPVPTDGRVRIGSLTKTFIAVLVLQLVDEGKVGLDASARTYVHIPSLPRRVTVRELLQHTSGLPGYGYGDPQLVDLIQRHPKRALTPEDILRLSRGVPASFDPGGGWGYSNTNYIYLGLLLEAVTDMPVATILRDRISEPLGLEETYLAGDEPGPAVIRAPISVPAGEAGTLRFGPGYPYRAIATSAWTSGALVSSASDLGVFFRALFHGHLISAEALHQMTVPARGCESDNPPSSYGLGLTEWQPPELSGEMLFGHGGGIPGFLTLVFYEPDNGVTYFAAATDLDLDLKPSLVAMVCWSQQCERGDSNSPGITATGS